ncbi:ommochrome-binding protein-like [Aricia agestis]|uniref:ommochrome-binding protein-like n=1 Tax=Aricia agestis TaxID=91739 RepID=UPI001C205617|nr:ommochrome-binding protein-like [Aricia agestis]
MNKIQPPIVEVNEQPHEKHILLADVNIPYKFTLDRSRNSLIFCINADEFSDQSFQSVVLDLNSNAVRIVPGIRNGFASAVDHRTGRVYLGGSDGIYKYDYDTGDVDRPPIVRGVDVFDMFYANDLYYVDTTNLDLHILKDNRDTIVKTVEDYGINHFAVDDRGNLIFANAAGLYMLKSKSKVPERFDADLNMVRGVTMDVHGTPYVIAQNGAYSIDVKSKVVTKSLNLHNGYALAFDRDNNIVYGEDRSVVKLTPS